MADGDYFAATNGIGGSASAQNLFSIENPTGSTINVIVRHVSVVGTLVSASATSFAYKLSRTSALPSAGTTQTAIQRLTTQSAPQAIVRKAPTASFATGLIDAASPGVVLGLTASGQFVSPRTVLFDASETDGIVLLPGQALLLGAEANTTSWNHYPRIAWGENAI